MTEPMEPRLQALAKEFQYPPTPSVTAAVMTRLRVTHPRRNRQLTWALTILIVLLAGLMSVPPVRAAVLEFIQIGIVRIFPRPVESPVPTIESPLTATPAPTLPSLIPLLEQMSGETTLDDAQRKIGIPIPLPTYPSDLGPPDRVFLQDAGGWMVILAWIDKGQPDRVRMSLHLIEAGSWTIGKSQPTIIKETSVNGLRAFWTVGEYPLILRNGDAQFTRMIDGNVLIWVDNKITYRLETDLELVEATRIAESLTP